MALERAETIYDKRPLNQLQSGSVTFFVASNSWQNKKKIKKIFNKKFVSSKNSSDVQLFYYKFIYLLLF